MVASVSLLRLASGAWAEDGGKAIPTLPDDVAYHLARTLHGVEASFCRKLAQACETTAANTLAAAPDVNLIHSGVLKYLREIGVAK